MLIAMVGATVSITSCKKDAEVGPKGDAGATGATGATGAAGAAGPRGNANVTSTFVTTTAASWTDEGGGLWTAELTDNGITQSILDNGAVIVYGENAQNEYQALPATLVYNSGQDVVTVNYYIGLQKVTIEWQYTDLTLPNPDAQKFKIVKIAGAFIKEHPTDYIELAAQFID